MSDDQKEIPFERLPRMEQMDLQMYARVALGALIGHLPPDADGYMAIETHVQGAWEYAEAMVAEQRRRRFKR